MTLPKPVRGPVTSRFGPRPQAPSPHNGQDWGWLTADQAGTTLIYAPTDGTVTVGINGLVGNFVILPIGGGYYLRLCHLSSVAVRQGQRVSRGQYLGHMGNTGSQAVGVHLHLDVFTPAGTRINPAPYFSDTFVGSLSQAGGGVTPITNPEDDMKTYSYIPIAGTGELWLQGLVAGRRTHIQAPYHVALLQRAENNTGSDPMLQGELDIVQGYISSVNLAIAPDQAPLLAKLTELMAGVDQLHKDLPANTGQPGGPPAPDNVDTAQILAAIAALNPLVNTIPKATADEIASRLIK